MVTGNDPVIVARSIECGAHDYVLKDTAVATFDEALTAIRAGRSFLPHHLATEIAMLGEGQSDQAITDTLSVSQAARSTRSISASPMPIPAPRWCGSTFSARRRPAAIQRDRQPLSLTDVAGYSHR